MSNCYRGGGNRQSLEPEAQSQPEAQKAAAAIAEFKERHHLGEPPAYYAVLALDGDQIGKWLGGERTPTVRSVLAPRAVEYFEKSMPEWYRQQVERRLGPRRHRPHGVQAQRRNCPLGSEVRLGRLPASQPRSAPLSPTLERA
jgi:hypothetical protein